MEIQVYTVSGITAEIKDLIEGSFAPVWVEGEIGNFTRHSSGHMYFSLKDEGAALRCVFFRQNNFRLKFKPEDGMKVLAFGELSVYEPSGQYQLRIAELRPAGVGDLQLAFEQLKAKLGAEGLFEEERKRPIPFFPEVVGVVTSPTGAAVRDIISVISRRCPPVEIVIYPVKVQGEGAAIEIAGGIRSIGKWGGADLIIAGRGGGSMEDLWAFNEEVVARAIAESPVPVISAVGHETDFTIADFVADLRAPTPSVAAELAVPDAKELKFGIRTLTERLVRVQQEITERNWQILDSLERGLGLRRLLERQSFLRTRHELLGNRLCRSINTIVLQKIGEWETLRKQLAALNPAAVMKRGFSLVFNPQGEIVREARQVVAGDSLEVALSTGYLGCRVETVEPVEKKIGFPVLPERLQTGLDAEKSGRKL